MIKAAIFDMDGLLINSEPLWQDAEIETFKKVGVNLTRVMCRQAMGLKLNQAIEYWYRQYPWQGMTKKELAGELIKNVSVLIKEKGKVREGVNQILEFLKNKNVKIALSSSSPMGLIKLVIKRLEIESYFEKLYSAESEKYGKPHPGIFLTTAKQLDILPENCLVFEDSLNGLVSAKTARMKCVCVPDESLRGDKRLAIADIVLLSLAKFNKETWNKLNN
jgi:mannitol-1-/sugar-/sorbitol-6-/2-deoxyglucose-6-phosphatase